MTEPLTLRRIRADLHIHTALSPCGGDDMTPPNIVRAAMDRGLEMIAICDHNSTGNVAAVQQAARVMARRALVVLGGIEITTAEEVHLMGVFPTADAAEAVGETVLATLPEGDHHYTDKYGQQMLMNARGKVIGYEMRMLGKPSGLTLPEAVDLVRNSGGLAIAAHVDRPAYGLVNRMGMLPPDVMFDALDLSSFAKALPAAATFASSTTMPAITSSDSHYLKDIGTSCCTLLMCEANFAELAAALRGEEGRRAYRA
jgi:predicted metal-dependent phosphoesterase TrpH